MPSSDAFRYFKQLLNGVEYLHSIGVSHRDLKVVSSGLIDYF